MSKGSAYVLPFFVPPPPKGGFLLQCRPVWYCQRARFVFPLGPNELPSVALLHDRSAQAANRFQFFWRERWVFSSRQSAGRISRVSLFRNLGKFCAICLLPANCADYTNSSSQFVFALFAQFAGKWLCLRMTRVIVSAVFALTRNAKKSVIPLFFARFSVTLYANFDF